MFRLPLLGLVLSAMTAIPAYAQAISDKAGCLSQLEIVKDLADESDVGEKAEATVNEKIGELEDLCESGDFEDADNVAEEIRGLLATEEPAEGPKKNEQ